VGLCTKVNYYLYYVAFIKCPSSVDLKPRC